MQVQSVCGQSVPNQPPQELTLCVGDATYVVPRARCVALSPVFKAMLEGGMRESRQDRITLGLPAPTTADVTPLHAYLSGGAPPQAVPPSLPLLANADFLQLNAVTDPLVRNFGRQAWTALDTPCARRLGDDAPEVLSHMPNVRDSHGRTALHHAAAAASVRGARLLLTLGANPLIRDKQGRIPLHHATESGAWYWWDKLLSNFLRRTDNLLGDAPRDEAWTTFDKLGRSPLFELVRRGKGRWTRDVLNGLSPDAVRTLVSAADHQGDTLLHVAMRALGGADFSVVSGLLAAGADPVAVNARGENPAHIAARHGPAYGLAAFVVLLHGRFGGRLCARMARMQDHEGRTPVHVLASVGGTLGVIFYGFDILGMQDRAGDTALHVAITQAKGVRVYDRPACFEQLPWREALNIWVPTHP